MLVDMNDDQIHRYVILENRYDPERQERRNTPIVAYSTERERDAAMAARAREIERSPAEGAPRSLSGVHWEPHYVRTAKRSRVKIDALERGVIISDEELRQLFP